LWIGSLSLLVLAAVLGALGLVAYLKYEQITASMNTPPPPVMPITVDFAKAESVKYRRSSVVVGNAMAPQSIRLRTELTGVVTRVEMIPGGRVTQGSTLIELDTQAERAELKSAEASRNLAESAFKRAKLLSAESAFSLHEYEAAAADLARTSAEVERLNILIQKKTLRAPFDAKAGLFDLHIGQYLDAGTEITTLEGIDDYMNIDFALPAQIADEVKVGDSVSVQLHVNSSALEATVVAMDSQADPISRAVRTRAKLFSPPDALQPNDSVRVLIEFGEEADVQAVPATAIRRDPSGASVFLVKQEEDGPHAEMRVVKVAANNGSSALIIEGLEAGSQVVADGSFKVTQGALLVDKNLIPAEDAQ
jgi:membrane fusion protein (multidrug efflux system)